MAGERDGMTVGILGLGLIGGSFARAFRAAGAEVLAYDTDPDVLAAAMVETVAGELDDASVGRCDLIVLAAYPAACVSWLRDHAELLGSCSDVAAGTGPVVIDTAGVKGPVCG